LLTCFDRALQALSAPDEKRADFSQLQSNRMRCIMRELRAFHEKPHSAITVYPREDNIAIWRCIMDGPVHTCYEGGTFLLYILFPAEFPMKPPEVRFDTPIYHCNVNRDGRICHSILGRGWTSDTSIVQLLSCIYGLLMYPEVENPLDTSISEEFFTSRSAYENKVLQWVRDFAYKPRAELELQLTTLSK